MKNNEIYPLYNDFAKHLCDFWNKSTKKQANILLFHFFLLILNPNLRLCIRDGERSNLNINDCRTNILNILLHKRL